MSQVAPHLSVIVPAHNPHLQRLRQTLHGLARQTLPADSWETLLVNNASTDFPLPLAYADVAPPNLRLVDEPRLGLTWARVRGFSAARGQYAVLVDDDNVLAPNYLQCVLDIFAEHPEVGVAGGKSLPKFDADPPYWVREFLPLLALRDLGEAEMISAGLRPAGAVRNQYPVFSPIGAGMALRRACWQAWLDARGRAPLALSDRRGGELTSSGDNDIVFCAMRASWQVGYFPRLVLEHLIPEARVEARYLERLNRGIQKSWMQLLTAHDANPWPPLGAFAATLRKAKAWLSYGGWSSPAARIRWQGACGHFDGRVENQPHGNRTNPRDFGISGKSLPRRLGLGALWLRLYHQPLGRARSILRQGGPWAMHETEHQRAQMEATAAVLPPLPVPPGDSPLCLHLLTGQRFWYQTAFCLHSFARATGQPVRAELYDDGSLSREAIDLLLRLGPAVHIVRQTDILPRLEQHLPTTRFPVLRRLWCNYPHIRKLTDVHIGRNGWKLVIDSDLLFFRRPAILLDWLRSPSRPLHAVDCTESYGYSRSLMERLAGAPVPPLVNVGLCGLRSDSLDWAELEAWCAELVAREGTSYYLEQALVAMLVAKYPDCTVAPAIDYITLPTRAEVRSPSAVMHHYVADSKRWYFRDGWRHVVSAPGNMITP